LKFDNEQIVKNEVKKEPLKKVKKSYVALKLEKTNSDTDKSNEQFSSAVLRIIQRRIPRSTRKEIRYDDEDKSDDISSDSGSDKDYCPAKDKTQDETEDETEDDDISAMTESDPFMGIESDNSTNNSVQDKQEVPSHPPAGTGFGLRLRSFAVDPMNNSFNAEANRLSNDPSTNASWHVPDEACPPDTTPNAEVSIYEVPSINMRPAFATPTVTYHHLPTNTVQAPLATMPKRIRQPIILRRALNQLPQQQQQQQLQMFQGPNGQLFGMAPPASTNQQQQTRYLPGQQITIRSTNRGSNSANVQVQQQTMAPSNIRTFTADMEDFQENK